MQFNGLLTRVANFWNMYANKDFTTYLFLAYNNPNTLYESRHQVEPDL